MLASQQVQVAQVEPSIMNQTFNQCPNDQHTPLYKAFKASINTPIDNIVANQTSRKMARWQR